MLFINKSQLAFLCTNFIFFLESILEYNIYKYNIQIIYIRLSYISTKILNKILE